MANVCHCDFAVSDGVMFNFVPRSFSSVCQSDDWLFNDRSGVSSASLDVLVNFFFLLLCLWMNQTWLMLLFVRTTLKFLHDDKVHISYFRKCWLTCLLCFCSFYNLRCPNLHHQVP